MRVRSGSSAADWRAGGGGAHQIVGRVGDHGAEDPGDVTGHKGHAQLLQLVALALRLGHHVLVQRHHRVLKARCTHSAISAEGRGATGLWTWRVSVCLRLRLLLIMLATGGSSLSRQVQK